MSFELEIKTEEYFENETEKMIEYQKMTDNPIYELQEDGELVSSEEGETVKVTSTGMSLDQEIEMEEALFNRAAKFGDII